jgi:PAS domain S-box-containing protein
VPHRKILQMSLNILLVEDNPADADLLLELLAEVPDLNWRIESVERLSSAKNKLSEGIFHLILLDLSLPDSFGLETLNKVRSWQFHLPIIVMTGLNDEAIALESVRLGAQDYLVKGNLSTELLIRSIRYSIERYQALWLHQKSELQFRAIFNHTLELVIILNPQGIIQEINQTALQFLELPTEEILGMECWDLQMWDNPESKSINGQLRLKLAIEKAAEGVLQNYETIIYGKNPPNMIVDFSLQPVIDQTDGGVIMLVIEARNITQRKQAEMEMIKAWEKEKELSELRYQFVNMVSHEFRTPMSTILLSSELLESHYEKWSPEKRQTHFQRIKQALKRMTDLLEDILIIGKVNAGKLEFKPTEINLLEFCQEIVSEIQNSVGINHQIIFQATADCPVGQMDEKLLRLILNNLLTNAVKYSSAGSQVHFLLDWQTISSPSPQPSRIVVLTIQDQGIGIPLADQKYLFSHFYRATNVGTVAGTGLGLAIVKQAVDLHGGEINFISEPELGTTFSVKLPLESY